MSLPKRYKPFESEPRLQAFWRDKAIYHFPMDEIGAVYSVDTPPPTVSGHLHLGHVYSYSHPDFMARFYRMRGRNVFYPMGFDDNGLPTERLVERTTGIRASEVGRSAFIEKCLQVSEQAEQEYRELWERLGLSIDWRYIYRTIDDRSRRISQTSFIDLYRKGLAYRREAPTIWCPECQTAIAQAELSDLDRQSEFVTLPFELDGGGILPIATTRPELLPACVAVFVHPDDERFRTLVGRQVKTPLFKQSVPVLLDSAADPVKGTGAVMCCTFGDAADVTWWNTHKLPLITAINRDGRMTPAAGGLAGMTVTEARQAIKQVLEEHGLLLDRTPAEQSVRVHERCDTPVEYLVAQQWFINLLDYKEAFLRAGEQIRWRPDHMRARYQSWVENLNWDWCISRQRYFGVPFPVWYCARCKQEIVADETQLPVDPFEDQPSHPCSCGSQEFIPEEDVFDTWATSSLSPQIVGGWLQKAVPAMQANEQLAGDELYQQVFPMSLRPQAHEIIRTWAFYTIAKSLFHFHTIPWKEVLISGWGIAGEGMGKISKSRGGGPMAPLEMIERYSADAVRYWAASTGPGKDATINEEKVQIGAKFINKLWNVSRFSEHFLQEYQPASQAPRLSPADRWILARTQRLISRVTNLMEAYEYAAAKSETEAFFWTEFADNYLEMAKQRLYGESGPSQEAARFTLYRVLFAIVQMVAPFLPFITEDIYQGLFRQVEGDVSVHRTHWPSPDPSLEDSRSENGGETLLRIATAVRRYKSERNLSLGTELTRVQLATGNLELSDYLGEAVEDLVSITRAKRIEVVDRLDARLFVLEENGEVAIAVEEAAPNEAT